MNADQAKFLAEHYAGVIESEISTTAKVLAAVSRGDGDYKPDPKSRSAIELARHIATADGGLFSRMLDGKFEFDQAAADKAEAQLETADDAVAFYEKSMRDKVEPAARDAGRQARQGSRFLRVHEGSRGDVPRDGAEPQRPSPRPACSIPARHGLARAVHLRRQCRRAFAGCCGKLVVISRSPHVHRPPPPRRRHRHGGGACRSAISKSPKFIVASSQPADRRCSSPTSRGQSDLLASSPICSAPRGAPSWHSASGRCG